MEMQDGEGHQRIRSVLIVGGGTAGWMAAITLARFLQPDGVKVRLVESDEIATVGVGEATIPPIMDAIRALKLDETALLRATSATIKLGIEFKDWTRPGHSYLHPFGQTGLPIEGVPFAACWQRMRLEGRAERLEAYSVQAVAAARGRFARRVPSLKPPLDQMVYALHFDAVRFAAFLRQAAEAAGVERTVGTVADVQLQAETGFIEGVTLADGSTLIADLFIDCTGFRGRLIEGALQTGYEDWSAWLPCDRAVAQGSERTGPAPPFTRATAKPAGWTWRIPLQHRVGNGHVYCSAFTGDDDALAVLQAGMEGSPAGDPRPLRFTTGRRRAFWNRNCVALGLAGGFLEPLESTSIHLIQRGLALLLQFFPDRACEPANTAQYNSALGYEFECVRDFLLFHYSATERTDPFWQAMREVAPPDSLRQRLELYRAYGRIVRDARELFPLQSWLYVLSGQGVSPRAPDPASLRLDPVRLAAELKELQAAVAQGVNSLAPHQAFLDQLAAAA
jgi:tryptophan 7-halogenase